MKRPGSREWARGRLETLLEIWDEMDDTRVAGTLKACLAAVDLEWMERAQRGLDALEES